VDLTAVQQDALVELINIGFGRAAAALSKLTGHRVQLEVPEITMCPIDQMGEYLRPLVKSEVASVHQIFSGPVEGDALLVLDQNSAAILKELLTNEPALPLDIDRSAREVPAAPGCPGAYAVMGSAATVASGNLTVRPMIECSRPANCSARCS